MIFKRTAHDICNLRIIVNAGSFCEARTGTAHYLEHMFFKGTMKRGYKELNALASKLGDINAFTGWESTQYHITFLAEDFEKAANLLFEMVLEPSFPEDEFEKERGVILQERQGRLDSPHNFALEMFWGDLYGDIGHPIVGEKEDIEQMTVSDLREYRERWYGGRNKELVLVGNIDKYRANTLDPVLYGAGRESFMGGVRPESINLEPLKFHHASKQAVLMMGWPSVSRDDECRLHQMPDIMANAIGQGMHSLLFERIREELGLCYSISASHCTQRYDGLFMVWCFLDAERIEQATEEIKRVLAKVCAEGLPEDLFDTAKKNYLFSVCQQFESASGIAQCAGSCFQITPDHLAETMNLDTRKRQIAGLSNSDITTFARKTLGAEMPFKYAAMTQG